MQTKKPTKQVLISQPPLSRFQVWSPTTSYVFAPEPSSQRSPHWMTYSPGGRWLSSSPSPSWPSYPEHWLNTTAKVASQWMAWIATESVRLISSRNGRGDDGVWGKRRPKCNLMWEEVRWGKTDRWLACDLLVTPDFCKVTPESYHTYSTICSELGFWSCYTKF